MKDEKLNAAVEDAVKSLKEDSLPHPPPSVFSRGVHAVRIANAIIASMVLSATILFLLFIIILYS